MSAMRPRGARGDMMISVAKLIVALPSTQASLGAAGADARLIKAVRSKDAASVRALIKQRVDVNAPQGDGATALHWAAHVDDVAIADLLIRAGARAAVANDNGFTPLHLACTNRSGAMVERLLSAGADANAASLNGETVLMTCARAGEPKAVKALLVKGAKRKREGERAQPDRAHVGRGAAPSRGDRAVDRSRRRYQCAVAHLRPDRRWRADAALRTRRVELHSASRRQHAAAVRRAIGRHGLGAAAARRRRERQRCAARRHQRPRACRAQRPRRNRRAVAREGRESGCGGLRLHGAACGGAEKRSSTSSRRCSRAEPIPTCARPRARRCAGTRQTSTCRRRSSARRRICSPRVSSSPTS